MSHTYHEGLPGYDARQIWHDGCDECEHRGKDLQIGARASGQRHFARAWRRAYDDHASNGGGYEATGDPSHCEMGLLNVLWGVPGEPAALRTTTEWGGPQWPLTT